MSQYPSPYSPPPTPDVQYDYAPQPAAGPAPARRAGVLMMVLGGLTLALGLCNGLPALMVPPEALYEQNQSTVTAAGLPGTTLSPEGLQMMVVVTAVATVAVGMAFMLLGSFVRRGSPGAITGSLVLCGLATLLIVGFLLMCLLAAAVAPVIAFVAVVVLLVPAALLILLLVWLAQARRAVSAVPSVPPPAWQYPQQPPAPQLPQQYYAGGAGYATAPAPEQQVSPTTPQQAPPPEGSDSSARS